MFDQIDYRHIYTLDGLIERFNNKINILYTEKMSYGVRNFKYFRNGILIVRAIHRLRRSLFGDTKNIYVL